MGVLDFGPALAYDKNNLKIGHLNINSIFGKQDEVVNLLDKCAFDILFISESKIDGSVSSTLFAHPKYHIIRKDRKKGRGGLLVYIGSNVTAHRQIKLELDGIESICLDVKGCANNWFLICACYRSPGKCNLTPFRALASDRVVNNITKLARMSRNLRVRQQQRKCMPNERKLCSLETLI